LSSDWGQLFLKHSTEKVSPSLHVRTETDPVSETLCFRVFRIPDKVQKPSDSEVIPLSTIAIFGEEAEEIALRLRLRKSISGYTRNRMQNPTIKLLCGVMQ
jgi:hypothetical protein